MPHPCGESTCIRRLVQPNKHESEIMKDLKVSLLVFICIVTMAERCLHLGNGKIIGNMKSALSARIKLH